MTDWPDIVRSLSLGLYFVLLGQSVTVILLYRRARILSRLVHGVGRQTSERMGLLPTHVMLVALTFLALATEAAWRTWDRVGDGFSIWAWFNLVIFTLGNVALWAVMRFEHTRVVESRNLMAFRIDPPDQQIVVDENTHQAKRVDRDR